MVWIIRKLGNTARVHGRARASISLKIIYSNFPRTLSDFWFLFLCHVSEKNINDRELFISQVFHQKKQKKRCKENLSLNDLEMFISRVSSEETMKTRLTAGHVTGTAALQRWHLMTCKHANKHFLWIPCWLTVKHTDTHTHAATTETEVARPQSFHRHCWQVFPEAPPTGLPDPAILCVLITALLLGFLK